MAVQLHKRRFSPYRALARFCADRESVGAVSSFVGIARAQGQSPHSTQTLRLDYYSPMTELCLEAIAAEAHERWSLEDSMIHHRVGRIAVGEAIVVVGALSGKRSAAFEACRYMTDMVKVRPALWKCEHGAKGECRWLEVDPHDWQRAQAWQNPIENREL